MVSVGHGGTRRRSTHPETAQMSSSVLCGRLILYCNSGPGFCSSGLFLRKVQHIRGRKRCAAAIFLGICFALELFDVNYQDVMKSGEKTQAADNVLGARTAFMQLYLEG